MANDKVVLITGTSSGFGQLAAASLSRAGYRVYGTSRRRISSDGLGYRMLVLDVRSNESVRTCVQTVLAEAGRIDVLVNNAGYVLGSLVEEATVEQAQQQFETNFWGIVRMTKAVLPGMRQRREGRIINISSLAGLIGVPGEGFYSATKFAIEGYSEALALEVRPFNIHVSMIEPGFFKTGIVDARQPATDTISDYDSIRPKIMARFVDEARTGGDPADVARLIQKVIESPRPKLRYRAGKDSLLLPVVQTLLPEKVFMDGARKWFHIPKKA